MSDGFKTTINVKTFDDSLKQLSSSFSCGNFFIDDFLKGSLAVDPGIGKTYIWLNDKETEIIGFYNITTGSLEYIDSDSRFKMGGAVHINEFALDERYHGIQLDTDMGIKMSDVLLTDCINRIISFRNKVGFSFITLHSTSEGFNLYKRHDFEAIEEDMGLLMTEGKERDCMPMYLPLDME